MRLKRAIILAYLLTASQPVAAADGSTGYGHGMVDGSCGLWISRHELYYPLAKAWVRGYVSAISTHSKTPILRKTDTAAIDMWIDNYCRLYPLHRIEQAAAFLVLELETPPAPTTDGRGSL